MMPKAAMNSDYYWSFYNMLNNSLRAAISRHCDHIFNQIGGDYFFKHGNGQAVIASGVHNVSFVGMSKDENDVYKIIVVGESMDTFRIDLINPLVGTVDLIMILEQMEKS